MHTGIYCSNLIFIIIIMTVICVHYVVEVMCGHGIRSLLLPFCELQGLTLGHQACMAGTLLAKHLAGTVANFILSKHLEKS